MTLLIIENARGEKAADIKGQQPRSPQLQTVSTPTIFTSVAWQCRVRLIDVCQD